VLPPAEPVSPAAPPAEEEPLVAEAPAPSEAVTPEPEWAPFEAPPAAEEPLVAEAPAPEAITPEPGWAPFEAPLAAEAPAPSEAIAPVPEPPVEAPPPIAPLELEPVWPQVEEIPPEPPVVETAPTARTPLADTRKGEPPARARKKPREAEPPAPIKLTPAAVEAGAMPAFGDQDFLDALENARSLYRQGQLAAGRAEMEQLYAEAEAAADDMRAMAVLDAFLEFEPFDVAASEQRVELRYKVAGPRGAVDALLALAEALEHAGLESKASATYQQVLDIDPSNAQAGSALRREREHLPKPTDQGDFIDLGALLLEDEEPDHTRYVVDAAPTGNEEQDFVDMLEQFKDKVAAHMGEDPQAHYDLGLAYKEMGLVDEAIEEFQIALRCGQDRLMVYEELGRCFLLKEKPSIALRVLQQALDSPHESEMDCMGVYYLLGRCHEELGNARAAREAYERVVGLDMQFQDVAERLARL